jgi:hypothetical protein
MSKDLFGIEEPDDAEVAPYVIIQLIPADGWQVVLEDDDGVVTRRALACFALVELKTDTPDGAPARLVRPMVGTEDGQVDDVELFEAFLCLLPPSVGVDPNLIPREYMDMVAAARQRRKAALH